MAHVFVTALTTAVGAATVLGDAHQAGEQNGAAGAQLFDAGVAEAADQRAVFGDAHVG